MKLKLTCVILTLAMLLSLGTLLVSAETTLTDAASEYGNGKVLYDEDWFKDNIDTAFTHHYGSAGTTTGKGASASFDSDTGRIVITADDKQSTVSNINVEGLDTLINYTVVADIYLTTGSGKKFGLGFNSANLWAKSTYIQATENNTAVYLNDNSSSASSSSKATLDEVYALGEKITMKIVCGTESVFFYVTYKDVEYAFPTKDSVYDATNGLAFADLGYAIGTGAPFFNQHNNTVIEIDNLMIYAGTGEPETTTAKVVGHGLAANDTIDMRFIVEYAASPAALDVAVTAGGKAVTPTVEKYEGTNGSTGEVYGADSFVYMYTVELSAKQMTDDVVLTVKNGDTTVVTDTYTVETYCAYWVEAASADGASDETKKVGDVCASMLLYGYMAQVQFGYNTDKLPTLDKTYLADLVK